MSSSRLLTKNDKGKWVDLGEVTDVKVTLKPHIPQLTEYQVRQMGLLVVEDSPRIYHRSTEEIEDQKLASEMKKYIAELEYLKVLGLIEELTDPRIPKQLQLLASTKEGKLLFNDITVKHNVQ